MNTVYPIHPQPHAPTHIYTHRSRKRRLTTIVLTWPDLKCLATEGYKLCKITAAQL